MTHVKLHAKIDKFLSERRHSKGGWAEVRLEDVKALSDIISTLISEKFDKDPDGDLPIEYIIVDRTRFERMSFEPVPYHRDAQTPEQKQVILDAHIFNLDVAHGEAIRMHRILRNERARSKK